MKSLKFFTLLFAMAALMLIMQCKKGQDCTVPETPIASSNSPVNLGGTILLSTASESGATYSWTGPNGYSSNYQNAAIPSATAAMAGTYSLKITVDGCTSAAGLAIVAVNNINCTPPATPSAYSNSPVNSKNTINLSTPTVSGATYSWTGPNAFSSALQNPTIAAATIAMAGTYSVVIIVNGCSSAAGSTTVAVDTTGNATPSCTPTNNTAQYDGFPDLDFYAVSGSTHSGTGNYEIVGNSSNGDLYIDFSDSAVPTDTVYSINSDCPTGFLTSRQVCVSTVTGGTFSTNFITTAGKVYVTSSAGKITVVFCGLTFYGDLGGNNVSFKGSAKMTTQ